ncbi:MAG: undecaprenyl-diphosphatase [Gammaproteobacteria bacterium]|nr:MAG: undecaprenyl-diphosphatase [Gammaproteobacteria bacterium]
MDMFQALLLAFIQGLTEFLPISSSAHLVIPSLLLDWPDQGLAFDVAVHVGTLLAVLIYYRQDLIDMARAWFASLAGRGSSDDSRLVWYLLAATVPAGLVGLFAGDFIEAHFRHVLVIGTTTLVFGIFLGIADKNAGNNSAKPLTFSLAMLIGLAQAFAPIPGVSRSGVTMTAGLLLGLSRSAAARFSFLLSIPIIAAAGLLKGVGLVEQAQPVDTGMMALGVAVSALTAYACIALFIRLIERVGMMPFVWYRVVLGVMLLVLAAC